MTGNPKDFVGASKAPLSPVSRRVMHELGLAMLEGECKYWRHNYRAADVRAMVYIDALERHISAWVEGQDIDEESGLSHLIKAMACLHIIRDAQVYGSLIDDRPPAQSDPDWMAKLNAKALEITKRLSHFERGAYTETNRSKWGAMSAALNNGPIKRIVEALGPVRTRLGEDKGPPIDDIVSSTYVPEAGERVRIVEIAPFDNRPFHRVGDECTTSDDTTVGSDDETKGWICFWSGAMRAGTWCRVEPVVPVVSRPR